MLEIKHLSKSYGNSPVKAVDDLSITLNAGEIYGFLGSNGAGKSTTIKSLVGIYPFQEGDILINGVSIKTDPLNAKKQIGYVSDNHAVFERLTGREYVNHMANLYKVRLNGYPYLHHHVLENVLHKELYFFFSGYLQKFYPQK